MFSNLIFLTCPLRQFHLCWVLKITWFLSTLSPLSIWELITGLTLLWKTITQNKTLAWSDSSTWLQLFFSCIAEAPHPSGKTWGFWYFSLSDKRKMNCKFLFLILSNTAFEDGLYLPMECLSSLSTLSPPSSLWNEQ